MTRLSRFVTTDVSQTEALGERLAAVVPRGTVLILDGDLGAGKTTFVKGVAKGLRLRKKPRSPTFALIREYGSLVHIDLYRLAVGETAALALEEYVDGVRVVAVEWGSRAPRYLWRAAPCVVTITIAYSNETSRLIEIEADEATTAALEREPARVK